MTVPEGILQNDGEILFARAGQGEMALNWKRVCLDIRKKLSTQRVVKHWTRFLRESVNVPPLEVFKAKCMGL